ncbi:MAG: ArsR family transcriptional regulator [Burkholderiales bacterium]|nr:ArsR family transcriptional regulator [Burkholderiales bacterium]
MKIKINSQNVAFFNALASSTRLKIIELLMPAHKNIKELATQLNLSSSIVAKHIEILENVGIIKSKTIKANRGVQKVCQVVLTDYHLVFDERNKSNELIQEFEVNIGHFVNYSVFGTCGLSTRDAFIGICDDTRYFSHPERVNAGILWFAHGEIEYVLPSFLFNSLSKIKALEFNLEICSEAPGINENFMSDIYFSINGTHLGTWLSHGDFGNKKGNFTPRWWYLTEYGDLVNIRIDQSGTYINEQLVSEITIGHLNLSDVNDSFLKISSPINTKNPGGVNLLGKGFGNYDQGIMMRIIRA